jgi:sodium-dependent dicarboxylate transporter 2/3/5
MPRALSSISSRDFTIAVALAAAVIAPLFAIDDPRLARSAAVIAVYLVLALTDLVPPFVPALFLLVATPLALGGYGPQYRLPAVLGWTADPVLALFAGGLALGLAARVHGIDRAIAGTVIRIANGRQRWLLGLVLAGTAVMSMWMSNIAAAAMVLAALRPVLGQQGVNEAFRRALLASVAMGANLGGMGTPIGSGPNALAVAAAQESQRITFLHWMGFALPLVSGLLVLCFVLIIARYRVGGRFEPVLPVAPEITRRFVAVVVAFGAAVLAWLSEPIHGVPSSLVALAVALLLFGGGILDRNQLGALDWSTLGLIAGGIALGRLIEHTGVFAAIVQIDWSGLPREVWLGGLVLVSAVLASVMSNTGTAALLIPLGMAIDPAPSTAVVIAIAASFGMPFAISTPPNAMAYGEGSLRTSDLLFTGGLLMLAGCAILTFTGGAALRLMGVP